MIVNHRRVLRALSVAVAVAIAPFAAVAVRVSMRVHAGLHPAREPVRALNAPEGAESITFRSADGISVRGWYVPPRNHSVIILMHGYGANRAQLLPEARALVENDYGVLLFDLRGHGASGGDGTTWGVTEQRDLEGALTFALAHAEVDKNRLGALGFSIGAMDVAQVAARDGRIRAAVLEGAYTSLEGMVRHDESRWGRWSEWVATETLRTAGIDLNALRPIDVVCRISPRPVLIVNGSADEDTPLAVGRSLFAAACQPKKFFVVQGAHHTTYAATAGPLLGAEIVHFFDASLRADTLAQGLQSRHR